MAGGAESKTEKATPKRRRDERKKGNIFQSQDIVTVASLISLFFVLKIYAPYMINVIKQLFFKSMEYVGTYHFLTSKDIIRILSQSFVAFFIAVIPLLLAGIFIGIVFTGIQTKFLVSFKSIKFKISKLNPFSGIKRMFSLRSLVDLLKSAIKIAIIGIIVYKSFLAQVPQFPRLMDMELVQAIKIIAKDIFSIVMKVSIIFVFVAGADYGYQWWDYEKKLRMGKQEIKEEFKQTEGDPQVKGKIKERQRAMAMNRMMQQVPEADVIIRNPTHFAVAIKYDREKDVAPIVVAKGMDHIALKIVDIAEKNNIYITENVPLARGLYKAVEVNMIIPAEFYHAVAEVLAYVYKINKKEIK